MTGSGEPPRTAPGAASAAADPSVRLMDAALDLLLASAASPSAEEIAATAELPVEEIDTRFGSVTKLVVAAVARTFERTLSATPALPPDLTLRQRIDLLVARRRAIYEEYMPLWRAGLIARSAEPAAVALIGDVRSLFHGRIELLFEPELRAMPFETRRLCLDALCMVTDWEAWHQLRRHRKLLSQDAANVMRLTMRRLLGEPD